MIKSPLAIAYGMGVDSTAMLVGYHQRGIRPDLITFADTGSEKPETYEYIATIQKWLAEVGFPPVTIVKYKAKKFKYGQYSTLGENCIRNGTLPSLAFGGKACSQKWKVAPQNNFCNTWQPALAAWAAGLKVTKAIGYDCSAKDAKRYAHSTKKGKIDRKYSYIYPLQQWGWDRERCMAEIRGAGLPVPIKSACYFCPASHPAELQYLPTHQLKAIIIMETRAIPQMKVAGNGLWRSGCKGTRGTVAKPGRMSEFIADNGLLPMDDVIRLVDETPMDKGCDHQLLEAFLDRELEGLKA